MAHKQLSAFFDGIAGKRLSAVEADPGASNQHEFNGVTRLKAVLGSERQTFDARFVYLGEDENDTASEDGFLTWYDAREAHPTRSEYRLYFPTTAVSEAAEEGDLLVIGRQPDGSALVLIVREGTTHESQVRWLFGLDSDLFSFTVRDLEEEGDRELGFAARFILDELGIEADSSDENWLDRLLARFGAGFPPTVPFSAFARETLPEVSAADDPDAAIIAWMNQEEMLFRTLERHIVGKQLERGFDDVDEFVSYSLSVQNRRKSRVGRAFENHLEQLWTGQGVTYSRGKKTENRAKPDFIFPGISHYRNPNFPPSRLTMLGVKSTCKDRWRQVLSEAARIDRKHLLTLEPGISTNQTDEMQAHALQLVLPSGLHDTYSEEQRGWLMDMDGFVALVRGRQV